MCTERKATGLFVLASFLFATMLSRFVLGRPTRGFLELRLISDPTVYNHVACQCLLLLV